MKPYTWRHGILKSNLAPTTRLVLLALSCHVNDAGESAFPSTKLLATETGLSERAVVEHLAKAKKEGWVVVKKHGFAGQKWARNEYYPTIPDGLGDEKGTDAASAPLPEGTDAASAPKPKGTDFHDKKALTEGQSNSPYELKEKKKEDKNGNEESKEDKLRAVCLSKREKIISLMPKVLSIYEIEAEKFVEHYMRTPPRVDYTVSLISWMQRANASAVPQQPPHAQKPHVTPEEADAIERTIRRYHEQPLHN